MESISWNQIMAGMMDVRIRDELMALDFGKMPERIRAIQLMKKSANTLKTGLKKKQKKATQ